MFKAYVSVKLKYILCWISQLYEKAQTYLLNAWKDISLYQNTSVTEQQVYSSLDSFGSPGRPSVPIRIPDPPLAGLLLPSVLHEGQGHWNTGLVLYQYIHLSLGIYIPLYDWTK